MRVFLALLLVFLAGPTGAAELLRYRAADGSLGFVDDERRLPPDAELLSRTPLEPRQTVAEEVPSNSREAAASRELPAQQAELPAATADDGDCSAFADRTDRLQCWREHGERCSRLGLPLRCAPGDLEAAERWCSRGEALRDEQTPIEDHLALARAEHRECTQRASFGSSCSRDRILEAERAVEVWELRIAALEAQCQEEDCIPGWVREGCGDLERR